MEKKSLVESAAKLISQQSELSEMGNRSLQESNLASIKRKHAAAVKMVNDHLASTETWGRPVSARKSAEHSRKLKSARIEVKKHRDSYVAAGGNVRDLGESTALSGMGDKPMQKNSVELEGNTITEAKKKSPGGMDHKVEFWKHMKAHMTAFNEGEHEEAQFHLNTAIGHAKRFNMNSGGDKIDVGGAFDNLNSRYVRNGYDG